jgi:hypothetical protein
LLNEQVGHWGNLRLSDDVVHEKTPESADFRLQIPEIGRQLVGIDRIKAPGQGFDLDYGFID